MSDFCGDDADYNDNSLSLLLAEPQNVSAGPDEDRIHKLHQHDSQNIFSNLSKIPQLKGNK